MHRQVRCQTFFLAMKYISGVMRRNIIGFYHPVPIFTLKTVKPSRPSIPEVSKNFKCICEVKWNLFYPDDKNYKIFHEEYDVKKLGGTWEEFINEEWKETMTVRIG